MAPVERVSVEWFYSLVKKRNANPNATVHFSNLPGTAREQILRTFSGQGTFCDAKNTSKYLKSLAHPTGFEPVTSAFGAI